MGYLFIGIVLLLIAELVVLPYIIYVILLIAGIAALLYGLYLLFVGARAGRQQPEREGTGLGRSTNGSQKSETATRISGSPFL
jgi:hypothetical protein